MIAKLLFKLALRLDPETVNKLSYELYAKRHAEGLKRAKLALDNFLVAENRNERRP